MSRERHAVEQDSDDRHLLSASTMPLPASCYGFAGFYDCDPAPLSFRR